MIYNKEAVTTLAKIWDVSEERARKDWRHMSESLFRAIIFDLVSDYKFDQQQQKVNIFADGYRSKKASESIQILLAAHNNEELIKRVHEEIPDYDELGAGT